ncbi:2-dehydropantoate 2-reductase [Haloarcula quadrata]|uniref:2-dehydropantoate 2-reductase n=1 Tax=Haloarcula quadrata TaxID=182779 RepID=UPI001FC97289|nr:2-dehydropantoate 2-reductase [Haloarcula quadrata]
MGAPALCRDRLPAVPLLRSAVSLQSLKLCVFGVGGIGGHLGARLAHAGHEVHLIARGDHLTALQTDGL